MVFELHKRQERGNPESFPFCRKPPAAPRSSGNKYGVQIDMSMYEYFILLIFNFSSFLACYCTLGGAATAHVTGNTHRAAMHALLSLSRRSSVE